MLRIVVPPILRTWFSLIATLSINSSSEFCISLLRIVIFTKIGTILHLLLTRVTLYCVLVKGALVLFKFHRNLAAYPALERGGLIRILLEN